MSLSQIPLLAQDGPYAPSANLDGSTAIHRDSSLIVSWAENVEINVGYMDINDQALGYASFGSDIDAAGYADNLVVSLGDGGSATYYFDEPLINGPGPDFAVFENSFSDTFLEFAHVELSNDGVSFWRFPSTSLTQDTVQVNSFGETDPTMIHNLAGKYRAEYGTPFDLEDMAGLNALVIDNVIAIRIVDVIGNIDGPNVSYDAYGTVINDPYPTPFESSGFDLDALALLNQTTNILELNEIELSMYPNPANNQISVNTKVSDEYHVMIFDRLGRVIENMLFIGRATEIDISQYSKGIYSVQLIGRNTFGSTKLIKM